MCGICGYISRKTITRDQLQEMNDSMIHRGPNDAGVELFDGNGWNVGLAQRRLAIQDLSPLGHQPMWSADGRMAIVFNGEVYNFQELREELSDYPFKSHTDTEVILAAVQKWGIQVVERFNGMFAIAIYDKETGTLTLLRDRTGQKPLYYWQDGENLVFASELKPIMLCPGFTKKVRRDVLSRYLFQQYINAPDSIFEDVYKLEPGSMLTFQDGQIKIEKYWDVASVYHKMQESPITDYAEAKAGLKKLLQEATARRMIADVPLGSFLSGGYDSSLISALAQEHLGGTPLKTFSIGFNEKEYDESVYAAEVAKHLGTDHTTMIISEKDMFDLVDSIPQFFDEPMADSSEIPTMLVSKLAREKVTVALSGDAGDEFYCGYNVYDNVAQAQKLDLQGGLAWGLGQLPLGSGKLIDRYPFKVRVIAANRNPETKVQFGAGTYVDSARRMVNTTGVNMLPVNYEMESRYGVDNWQIRRMLLDIDTYMTGDILAKVDRASMKYSLESRCPMLDKEVMEYSFRLDHSFKYHDGSKKYILKDLAYDYIPKELLERPKKGFGVPLDKWLRGPLKEQLISYADPKLLKEQGLFDVEFTTKFIQDYLTIGDGGPATGRNFSGLVWSFFVFQQWYRRYFQ